MQRISRITSPQLHAELKNQSAKWNERPECRLPPESMSKMVDMEVRKARERSFTVLWQGTMQRLRPQYREEKKFRKKHKYVAI